MKFGKQRCRNFFEYDILSIVSERVASTKSVTVSILNRTQNTHYIWYPEMVQMILVIDKSIFFISARTEHLVTARY